MTTLEVAALIALLIFTIFCNIGMIVEISKEEGKYFFEKWDNEVGSQKYRIGKIGMRVFYLIPGAVAILSKIKKKKES